MDRNEEVHLVERCKAGDSAAQTRLIRAMQGPLYSYLLRMCGKAEAAEDATQEALFKALTHIDKYDARWRFSTWLFTIGRRVLCAQQQRKQPEANNGVVEHFVPAVQPVWAIAGWTTEKRDQQRWQRDHLAAALARLTPVQRDVLVLFHQQEWSIERIAQSLEVPEGTVKSHLSRARARLRMELDGAVLADGLGSGGSDGGGSGGGLGSERGGAGGAGSQARPKEGVADLDARLVHREGLGG